MPINKEDTTTIEELLNKSFPEFFALEDASHSCVYCRLLGQFILQDLQKQSTDQLEGKNIN